MKTEVLFFGSLRYWQENSLKETAQSLGKTAALEQGKLVTKQEELPDKGKGDLLIAVPLSGAVQPMLIKAAENYRQVLLYAAYADGVLPETMRDDLLRANAAPTVMDCYGVLKRRKNCVLCLSANELHQQILTLEGEERIRKGKILAIGEMEPWVISPSRKPDVYHELFGIEIVPRLQQEVLDRYAQTKVGQADRYLRYMDGAKGCVEPTEEDRVNAAKMAAALTGLLEESEADGVAVACFDMLRCGTTACLGVSYINDSTKRFAACEGDLDSAVTMFFAKQVTDGRVWMANPAVCPDGTILYSHCTAPLHTTGSCGCGFTLRSHHESGIGVSLQVDLPTDRRATICRISSEDKSILIMGADTFSGPRRSCCRTQLYVRPDSLSRYLEHVSGCHQVILYGDLTKPLSLLASRFGLTVLS